MPGVELQTPAADDVERLQHQGVFDVRVINELLHHREKHLHVLVHAEACGVNADISNVVLLRQLFDGLGLRAKVHAAPLVALQNAELAARHRCRGYHHAPSAVAVLRTLRRVVTDSHFAPAKRPQRKRFKIGQYLPAVYHALLQQLQREHGRQIVHKFAHQQVLVFRRAVFESQLVEVSPFRMSSLEE